MYKLELLPCVCLNFLESCVLKSKSCDDMTKPDELRLSGGVNNFIPDYMCLREFYMDGTHVYSSSF